MDDLPEFVTNHWDRETLCASFRCRECVASPEDLGYSEWEPAGDCEEDWEIPF